MRSIRAALVIAALGAASMAAAEPPDDPPLLSLSGKVNGAAEVEAGEGVGFTATVTNLSLVPRSNAVLTVTVTGDPGPVHDLMIKADGWTCDAAPVEHGAARALTCRMGELAASVTTDLSITALSDAQWLGTVSLTATVTADGVPAVNLSEAVVIAVHGQIGGAARVNSTITLNGDSSRAWTRLVFPLTLDAGPDRAGYYFTRDFRFTDGDTDNHSGYLGILPRPDGKMETRFSVFDTKGSKDTRSEDAKRCRGGADDVDGVTCGEEILLPFVHGHRYDFTIAADPVKDDRVVWRGSVKDATDPNAKPVEIGAWSLPTSWGYLASNPGGFIELLEIADDCDDVPLIKVTWGEVRTGNDAYPTDPLPEFASTTTGSEYGKCMGKLHYQGNSVEGGWQAQLGS